MINKLLHIATLIFTLIPYIYLFSIFSLCIAIIFYKKHKRIKKQLIINKKEDKALFYLLNYFYVHNIWFLCLQLFLLLCGSIGLVISLRLLNLGSTYNTWLFMSNTKSSINFGFVFILLCLSIYLKIIDQILFDIYFKIHLYLRQYHYYARFSYYMKERYQSNLAGLFLLNTAIRLYLRIILQKTDIEHIYNNPDYIITLSDKIRFYLRKQVQSNKKLFAILIIIYDFTDRNYYLDRIQECLFHYWPRIILFSTIYYDLKFYEIKYSYYASLLYLIITLYRRFRKFIGETDYHDIDDNLITYFYKDKTHEKLLQVNTDFELNKIIFLNSMAFDLYENYEEKIKLYFERNYRVDYIDINYKKTYEPDSMRLFFTGIFLMNVGFGTNVSFKDWIIINIPLLLGYLIYEYTYQNQQKIKNIIVFTILYSSLIIIAIILIIWIYLTRHTLYFMTETIWSFGFIIKQEFTQMEKYDYMLQYLSFILEKYNLLDIQKSYLIDVFEKINHCGILTADASILQIKTLIDNLYHTFICLEYFHYKHYMQYCNLFHDEIISDLDEIYETLAILYAFFYIIFKLYIILDYPKVKHNFLRILDANNPP